MEPAKKNKLSVEYTSNHMKLCDEWKAAKGNHELKTKLRNDLRSLYKRTVYKKSIVGVLKTPPLEGAAPPSEPIN